MNTETYITAGPVAAAEARPGASFGGCTGATTFASYAPVVHPVSSGHPTSTWTQGAIAQPATLMVFDAKNRPTRPLSELSP
jgi:hypothetical protein